MTSKSVGNFIEVNMVLWRFEMPTALNNYDNPSVSSNPVMRSTAEVRETKVISETIVIHFMCCIILVHLITFNHNFLRQSNSANAASSTTWIIAKKLHKHVDHSTSIT